MKKWTMMMLAVCVAGAVSAAPQGVTKAQHIEAQKQAAAKGGWKFDAAKCAEKFDKQDANNDGVLTTQERAAYREWMKQQKN